MNAIKKYGKENFNTKILEEFDTKQEAFDAQEKYIIEYKSLVPNGYNISPKGGHQCKDGASKESRRKMSISKFGNTHKKGSKLSDESKKRISDSRMGEKNWNFNKNHSKEWCKNISEGLKIKIMQNDLEGNIIQVWKSAKDVSETLFIPSSNINKVLKGERKSAGGFNWSYETKSNR